MRNSQTFMLAAALVLPGFGAWSVSADDLFRAQVQTTAVVTNSSGGLSYSNYGNRQILKDAADAAGLTNLSGLRLVYNKTNDTLEVVMGTNDMVVATPMTFNGGVSLSKTNDTVVERLAWVYLGTNGMAAGNDTSGEAGIDFNYGAAPNLQLTATVPVEYDFAAFGPAAFGPGNVELAAKYRFLHQDTFGLDVSVFPRVFLPSGSNAIGDNHMSLLLPLWVQKDFAEGWSAFGCGGCTLSVTGNAQSGRSAA